METNIKKDLVVKSLYKSPIGPLYLSSLEDSYIKLSFENQDHKNFTEEMLKPDIKLQLENYFKSNLDEFSLKLNLTGTDLQISVWNKLKEIPFGKTCTYSELSESLGIGHAVRAVANAVGRNPLPIIIPCHRVIGKSGSLTGYIGGLSRKKWLLDFEGNQQSMF